MKTCSLCILFALLGTALADELITKDGRTLKNVTIISADPERMLVVHDGGGEQVGYSDLLEDSLSESQKEAIKQGLVEYAERQVKLEELRVAAETSRLEREAFEQAQREKGLIKFEDAWMTPQDRQDILAAREMDRLKKERMALELEKEKAELRKSQLIAEQERARLISYEQPRTVVYSTYYPSRRVCELYPKQYSRRYRNKRSGLNVSFSSCGSSITYRSSTPKYSRVSVPVTSCGSR